MLNIPRQYSSLEFVGPLKWPAIFAAWRAGEALQVSWKKHWEERGFSSWEDWRKNYAEPLDPKKLDWYLYDVKNPAQDFPLFYGVPSRGWIKKTYGGETTKRLKELIDLPIVKNNPKILEIKRDFPKKTLFTGIVQDAKIILIEGMHRACALAGWDNPLPPKSEIQIALALWDKEKIPILGKIMEKFN
jgi:hypothetical protein